MRYSTALAAASVAIGAPTYTYALPRTAAVVLPAPAAPAWLSTTERVLRDSIVQSDSEGATSGKWITQEVADAATSFFQMNADLLPGAPQVYSSNGDDLIAEFKADRGTMTAVISPTFRILFAVIGDTTYERRVSNDWAAREELSDLVGMLVAHGVESTR